MPRMQNIVGSLKVVGKLKQESGQKDFFVFLIFHPSSKADGSAVDKTTGYYQHGKLPLNGIKETLFCCCFSFLRQRGGCKFAM